MYTTTKWPVSQTIYRKLFKLEATIWHPGSMPGEKNGTELVLQVQGWAMDLRKAMRDQLAALEQQYPGHAITVTPAGDWPTPSPRLKLEEEPTQGVGVCKPDLTLKDQP